MRGKRWLLAASCALAAAVAVAGCGGDSSSHAQTASSAATQTQTQTDTTAARSRAEFPYKRVPSRWKEPPESSIGPHPGYHSNRVVVHEIARGTGPVVRPHDYALLDYIEVLYTTGQPFNEGWGDDPGAPTAGTILAPHARLRGLVIGMRGMRVGGRRRIIVPPRLAGIEPGHMEYRKYVYWDVVLRGIAARGCAWDGEPCRSAGPSARP